MIHVERSGYSALDFAEWNTTGKLILSPKFQRRSVWTPKTRSYFIDSIVNNFPVPPIYLRVVQSDDFSKTIREVVDGQQRIRSVLDYLSDKYPISKSVGSTFSGKKFSKLPAEVQQRIRSYSFNCEIFQGVSDEVVLGIFARLNTYSVSLNRQELRNGRYFGYFKRLVYDLARSHLAFWRQHRICSNQQIARMADAELVSELIVAQIAGMQDKKNSLDDFYEKYDDEFSARSTHSGRFERVMEFIDESVGDVLASSEFRRRALFYSLFCAAYHRIYGMPSTNQQRGRTGKIADADLQGLNAAVTQLSDILRAQADDERTPRKYEPFVNACARQTDNIKPRETRFKFICDIAFGR